jgi:hypothetical protein
MDYTRRQLTLAFGIQKKSHFLNTKSRSFFDMILFEGGSPCQTKNTWMKTGGFGSYKRRETTKQDCKHKRMPKKRKKDRKTERKEERKKNKRTKEQKKTPAKAAVSVCNSATRACELSSSVPVCACACACVRMCACVLRAYACVRMYVCVRMLDTSSCHCFLIFLSLVSIIDRPGRKDGWVDRWINESMNRWIDE